MSKFTDDVHAALGVINTWELTKKYQCPAIYFFTQHPHAIGHSDHRAEVSFWRDERRWKKEVRTRRAYGRLTESRDAHLKAAIEWAEKKGLGVEEWVPSGFPNTWIPKDVKARMTADLKAWRKEQRTKEATK